MVSTQKLLLCGFSQALFQGIFLTQGSNPCLTSPALAGRFFTTGPPGKPPHVLGKTKQNKKELISSLAHHNCEERCGSWSLHPPNKPCPLAYLLLFFTQIKSFSKNNPLLLSQVSDGSFVYRANHFANTPLSSPLIYFPSHHSSSTGKSYI